MKASELYAPTLRESPAEAELLSHKLMFRAGLIRKAAGGMHDEKNNANHSRRNGR